MDIDALALIEIVRDASQYMINHSFKVTQKDGYANIVTTSDVKVQEHLCHALAEFLPGSGFLCEEEDMHDCNHEYTWIIDPIDGTANYSRGIDQCAISVGLKHEDEMLMGVVYIPATGEMFHAVQGQGAYLNGEPIHVSDRPFSNAVLCTALPVYHKEYADTCAAIILEAFKQCNDVRRFGAAAPELCYVAMGRCELYFEYQLSPWDYAAGHLILQEAGGHVSDLHGNSIPLTRPSGILGANSRSNLHKLMEIVLSNMDDE